MGIVLDMGRDNKQSIFIGNGYLPTNIDSKSKNQHENTKNWKTEKSYITAREQHLELNARAMDHDQAILTMDANETTTPYGRIITYNSENHSNRSNTASGPNKTQMDTLMACYTKNFIDAHKYGNPHEYNQQGEITGQAYTHSQKIDETRKSRAKLDYTYITKGIASNIRECSIHDNPKYWSDKPTESFHSVIKTRLHWTWNIATKQNDINDLKGSTIRRTINTNKLTEHISDMIAKEVHEELKKRWKEIKGIKKGKLLPIKKATLLNDIFHNTIERIAIKHLGTSDPSKIQPSKMDKKDNILAEWDRLHTKIGKWILTRGNKTHTMEPALGEYIENIRNKGVYIPKEEEEIIRWWQSKDLHRSQVQKEYDDDMGMSDESTMKNKKKFFGQISKKRSI